HPHVGARHVGGGGQDPGAVRAGGGGSHGENGGGGEAGCEIPEAAGHGWFPYFFRLSLIAPSSEPPLADRLSPPFGGHWNGMRRNSRPPSSRAASMTNSYWPAGRLASGF